LLGSMCGLCVCVYVYMCVFVYSICVYVCARAAWCAGGVLLGWVVRFGGARVCCRAVLAPGCFGVWLCVLVCGSLCVLFGCVGVLLGCALLYSWVVLGCGWAVLPGLRWGVLMGCAGCVARCCAAGMYCGVLFSCAGVSMCV
jgi:hypothetical protein